MRSGFLDIQLYFGRRSDAVMQSIIVVDMYLVCQRHLCFDHIPVFHSCDMKGIFRL